MQNLENSIVDIRKAFLAGETQSNLARKYGTSKEVIRQAVRYVTFSDLAPELKDQCLSAEALGNKALTGEKVGEMRRLYRESQPAFSELAARYNCTVATIRSALSGKSKYKTDEPPIELKKQHVRGSQHPGAKLTDAQVVSIREAAVGGMPVKNIAQMYSISVQHANDIVIGRARANVG